MGNYISMVLPPKEGEAFRVKYVRKDSLPRVYLSILYYNNGDYKHRLFINKDSSSYETCSSSFVYNHFKKLTMDLYNDYLNEQMKPLLSMDCIDDL